MYRNFVFAVLLTCGCYEMGVLIGRAPYQNVNVILVPHGYIATVTAIGVP